MIVVSLNERTELDGSVRSDYFAAAGLSSTGATANACPPGGCGGDDDPPPPPPPTNLRTGAYPERLERIAIYDDHENWTAEPAEIKTTVLCAGQSSFVFASTLGDPEPEKKLLHAGIHPTNFNYEFREDFNSQYIGTHYIDYFTWDRTVYGPNCAHNLYEDDGGTKENYTASITDPDTGITVTASEMRSIDRQDMGIITFLYTEPLTTTHRTLDFELDMK